MSMPNLSIEAFDYDLPEANIAKFPLAERSHSKLLCYNKGRLTHRIFKNLNQALPAKASLVLNNTKVVAARLKFQRETGATIEIFCLEPDRQEMSEAMAQQHQCVWKCMVGNLKRFKTNEVLVKELDGGSLRARIHSKDEEGIRIAFKWTNGASFSEILADAGQIPLPPYLNRETTASDTTRYQTVYAEHDGAVAAPTAGLHFAENQLEQLKEQGHDHHYVTLHVSAGTFKPVKAATLAEHDMHSEKIVVSSEFLQWAATQEYLIAVGTTSLRTLESLYWLAVKGMQNNRLEHQLTANDAYELPGEISSQEAFLWLVQKLEEKGTLEFIGQTALFTMPGYSFKVIKGLITNFHQPRSTLLALIAALVGDTWKDIYAEAFDKGYRFLSYGDSSLLLP